jgi:hypothetical protein
MKEFWARQKMFSALILSMGVFPLNGCVYLVAGGIGAFGGYVASPDTVEGTILDRNYDIVWTKAGEVASMMGMVEDKNDAEGVLSARVQGANVKITVLRVGSASVKLSVKAREGVLPRVKIAQDVYVKIVSTLDVTRWDG